MVGLLRKVRHRGLQVVGWIATPSDRPELLARFQPGKVVLPAWCYLQRIINRKLSEHGSLLQLLWDHRRAPGKLELRGVPRTLIAALWSQFAQVVGGNLEYRHCAYCGKPFGMAPIRHARTGNTARPLAASRPGARAAQQTTAARVGRTGTDGDTPLFYSVTLLGLLLGL